MHYEPFNYLIDFAGADALAANGTRTLRTDIDGDTDFAVFRMAAVATSFNFRASLNDQRDRTLLFEGTAAGVGVFGTGQWPMRLKQQLIVKRNNQIRVTLTDRSGVANTVRLLFAGAHIYPRPIQRVPPFRRWEPYALRVNFGVESTDTDSFPEVPANGLQPGSVRVPGDSWFEVRSIRIARTGAATIQITTDGYQEWFRRPVHVDLLGASDFAGVFGGVAGRHPAVWEYELTPGKFLAPNVAVQILLADLSGALNSVRILFDGIRRWE